MRSLTRRDVLAGGLLALVGSAAVGCAGPAAVDPDGPQGTLRISALPEREPDELGRLYRAVAERMSDPLRLQVAYVPAADYDESMRRFRTGGVDLSWFPGLAGVRARLLAPGAVPLVRRDVDTDQRSVFVVGVAAGLTPSPDLSPLAGRPFAYGEASSVSGRLMPAWFLREQGVDPAGFPGGPVLAGSHEAVVDRVAGGAVDAGVLSARVWDELRAAGRVPPEVVEYARTEAYADHCWLMHPQLPARLGGDIGARLTGWFTGLSATDPGDAEVLDLCGAGAFVPAGPADLDRLEGIARELGLVEP
ncbi:MULTISPECIES: PhnD/SsuA/transferrin family substrate-binding protein [unclassified Blastococcus]